jgi:hypothetical protein
MTWQEQNHFDQVLVMSTHAQLFMDYDFEFRRRRSCGTLQAWLQTMIGQGGFIKHLESFIEVLSNRGTLVSLSLLQGEDDDDGSDMPEEELARQEFIAYSLGQGSLGSIKHCLRRNLDMFGWPLGSINVLEGDDAARDCRQLFMDDWNLTVELMKLKDKTPIEGKHDDRCFARLTANVQIHLAFNETPVVSDAFIQVTSDWTNGCVTTLPVEELNGVAKNNNTAKVGKRFKRPLRTMAQYLSTNMLHDRWHFKSVRVPTAYECTSVVAPNSLFSSKLKDCSLDVSDVAGTSQTPSFTSPSAQHFNMPVADTFARRELWSKKCMRAVEDLWFGLCL